MLNETFRDYNYFKNEGWFESDFFYPTAIGPFKKLAGKLFDGLAAAMVKREQKKAPKYNLPST
jgi:hypothetical protein